MMLIQAVNHYINKILCWILALFMSAMIIAVVWQVFTRFVLHDPASFTDELSRYLLIWIGVLGGAYTYAIKRHLALELIIPHCQRRGKLLMSILINAIVVAFSSITFIYGGWYLVSDTLMHGQISPGIAFGSHHLLIGYVYLVVPIAGGLISYFGLIEIINDLIELFKGNHSLSSAEQI